MKKYLAIMASIFMAATTIVCGAQTALADSEDSGEEKQYTMYLSTFASDETANEVADGLKQALGDRGTVTIVSCDGKLDQQISDIDTMILKHPDVIFVNGMDSTALVPVVQRAVDEGIPVITINSSIEGNTFNVALDFYTRCVKQADILLDYLEKNPDAHLYIGYGWGMSGVDVITRAYQGFIDKMNAATEYEGRWEILAEQTMDWSAEKTIKTVEDWRIAYPEMNCFVSMSDTMTCAALQVLIGEDIDPASWVSVGADGSQQALEMIAAGQMTGTIYLSNYEYTAVAVEEAIKWLEGTSTVELGEEVQVDAAIIVTADNVDQYLNADVAEAE